MQYCLDVLELLSPAEGLAKLRIARVTSVSFLNILMIVISELIKFHVYKKTWLNMPPSNL